MEVCRVFNTVKYVICLISEIKFLPRLKDIASVINKIICVYSENDVKHTSALSGQKAELFKYVSRWYT
jgi:hypothetical protein